MGSTGPPGAVQRFGRLLDAAAQLYAVKRCAVTLCQVAVCQVAVCAVAVCAVAVCAAVPGTAHAQEIGAEPSQRASPPASALRLTPSSDLRDSTALASTPPVGERDLELALRWSAHRFDAVDFIGAQRTLLMAIFETYCAGAFLIPTRDGLTALDAVLGAGCLLGATTLYVMAGRRIRHPKETLHARERLVSFYRLRRAGDLEASARDELRADLAGAAKRDRRRRWVRFTLGILELGAAATVAGLTARGRIDGSAGTSIAIGTSLLSLLGLSNAFIRSPAETAWEKLQSAPSGW